MRSLLRPVLFLVLLAPWIALAGTQELRNFAMLMGLSDVDAFVETVETIRDSGYLPRHYLTKGEARDRGWYPGSDLCDVAPGYSIGGNRFGNREGRLPDQARAASGPKLISISIVAAAVQSDWFFPMMAESL